VLPRHAARRADDRRDLIVGALVHVVQQHHLALDGRQRRERRDEARAQLADARVALRIVAARGRVMLDAVRLLAQAHRERRRIAEAGIHFATLQGGDISPQLWKVIYAFSANTFARHGHEHYLSAKFFIALSQAMPENIMVKLALRGREPVAAAIFFEGGASLYGRYWGAAEDLHSLHFEACYYQGIEYCIDKGLQHFEPGTQGEHKVPRGFVPTITSSAHWIAEPRFRRAIADYLERERASIGDYVSQVEDHVPFRSNQEELDVPEDPDVVRGMGS